jgi:hypothetical protein
MEGNGVNQGMLDVLAGSRSQATAFGNVRPCTSDTGGDTQRSQISGREWLAGRLPTPVL